MASTPASRPRPLSPHLQVYKPQLTSVLSILHRITGIIAFFGSLCLLFWLIALAWDDALYGFLQSIFTSTIGLGLLLIWTLVQVYHLCNGVRHLFWDAGLGLALPEIYRSGKLVLIATFIITALIWLLT